MLRFPSGQRASYSLQSVRVDRQSLIVSLVGITSREAAAQLRGAVIEVMPDDLPGLLEGSYYHKQIIGLRVVTTEGIEIGRITDIFETGSNDVYVVRGHEKEHLIPAIRDVVMKIDLLAGRITIYPMKGLLE